MHFLYWWCGWGVASDVETDVQETRLVRSGGTRLRVSGGTRLVRRRRP